MTQFPRTRFDLNLARIVLSDRVTFYDPRSSSNTPGLFCDLITHERRSPLSFSKNESRAFEVSLEERYRSVVSTTTTRWENALKRKNCTDNFFFLILFYHFPSFLFLSLSLSSFRFKGFRFVKNEYTKLSTLSSKRNNERDILKLTRPVGVSRWPNCGEPNEFRSCRINCVCSGSTHMDLHKLYASKPFCRVEPDSISRSITTIVLLRLPSSNRTRNKKHRLGIEMDLWKRDVKE